MKQALINPENGRVQDVVASEDDVFPVAPPMHWVACPDTTIPNDFYADEVFTPQPAPPVANGNDTPIEEV